MLELTEVMRQRGDHAFSELLCRVITNCCTTDDIRTLQSREIPADTADYPTKVLHVYRLNADVDTRNTLMLNSLAPQSAQYTIKAIDSVAGESGHISLSSLSDKRSETGGLHGTLKLAIGARVMLTANVDVADGLVNGARGEVVHVVTNNNNVTSVLVKFDNNRVGLKSIQTSPQRARFPNAVPLNKYEVVFFAKGKRGSEIKHLQFALTLAWATTIHKVQGLTLDEIVVDMRGGRFSPGQAYVAFSRVKTLDGLHILNFNSKAIKKSIDVESEMFRLNSNIFQPVSQVTCDPSSQVTTALLNVRSILAKLPDITTDHSLKSASILCFCETWLNASHPSPVLLHGIEAVSATIQIPNARSVQVAVVYRSPNVPQAMLITVLTRLLTHVSLYNSPCLILGDFNENILHQQNTAIVRLMAYFSFTQLVQSPTTAQGTLIDHVYYRNPFIDPASSAIIQVQDTYYSDHDTVYCSIP